MNDEDAVGNEGVFVARVLNILMLTVRPLRKLAPMRGELEVSYFGREYLEALVTPQALVSQSSSLFLSLLYLLFIDNFGVHRNIYRALKAFYLIPAYLDYEERRKLANVFTLILGPYGAKIENVIGAIKESIKDLDAGMEMEINGDTVKVSAHAITFLGDML